MDDRICIPRDRKDDYTWGAASRRRELVKDQTGVDLCQVGQYSFDPDVLRGNIENFVGVIQRLCQPARRSYRRYGPGGDISLMSAIVAGEWVPSHEQYGCSSP